MGFGFNNYFFKTSKYAFFSFLCLYSSFGRGQELESIHFPKEAFLQNDENLLAADEFFAAGLYTRAIDLYQKILKDLAEKKGNAEESQGIPALQTCMQARFHLAQAYFVTEQYQKTLDILQDNLTDTQQLSPSLENIRQNSIYLAALTYKQTKQFSIAKQMMEIYAAAHKEISQSLRQEAQLEIAIIDFLSGHIEQAKTQLKSLQLADPALRLSSLCQLYLARIHQLEGHLPLALSVLNTLSAQLPASDDLHYELSYLLGQTYFLMHDFVQAANYFERALPKHFPESCNWYAETLYFLGWSNLNMADVPLMDVTTQKNFFNKAEAAFQKLLAYKPDEKVYLALGQHYLARAKRLKEASAYTAAEDILSRNDAFTSLEARTHALLLRAEAAATFDLRNSLYQQIISDSNQNSSFFAKGWFLYALNNFEEGQAQINAGHALAAKPVLAKAAQAFKKAFELLKDKEKSQAVAALKYQALALSQSEADADNSAFTILDQLIHTQKDLLEATEYAEEIYYLHGFFALRLADTKGDPHFATIATQSFHRAAASPKNKFSELALNHLAAWHYRKGNYAEAENLYLQLMHDFPNSDFQPEAWLWAACCADKLQKDPQIAFMRRSYVIENYPQSPWAAEADFTLYTYPEYLQGNREALKHLQSFLKKYSETPYLIEAYFLIGLDFKRNRKTPEGKWIRKKSLTDAIDAFQQAETVFDTLAGKSLIPSDKLDFYINVYYRTILERAMANLAIAEESQGAKRQIYLEYAEEVFKGLIADFSSQQTEYAKRLYRNEDYPALYEEGAFWLAQTYIKRQKDHDAASLLSKILERYEQAKITRGYYLSRIKYEQGKLAFRQQNYTQALQYFKQSEEAAKGQVLGTDEKLDLWIQQSHCHRDLCQYDDALLILSKVANDDAISALRLKAMYLRSDIYELQERPELARKQLESLAKKGGDWALKAQEKLEKTYGY